jgi:hypothetical protein
MYLTSLRVGPGFLALVDDLFLCVFVYISQPCKTKIRILLNDLEPSYNEQHQQIRICPKERSKICPEQAA